jgi:hypothetical protein
MATLDIVTFVQEEQYKLFWRYLKAHPVTRYGYERQFSGCGYFQLFLSVVYCAYTSRNINFRHVSNYRINRIAKIYKSVKNAVENEEHALYKFITAKNFQLTDRISSVSTITDCTEEISPCIIYHQSPTNATYYIQHFFTIVKKDASYWVVTSWGDSVLISGPDAIQIVAGEFDRLISYLGNSGVGNSGERRTHIADFNALMSKYFLSKPKNRLSNINNGPVRNIPVNEGVQTLLGCYQSDTSYRIGIIPNYVTEICTLVHNRNHNRNRNRGRTRRNGSTGHNGSTGRNGTRHNGTGRNGNGHNRSRSPKKRANMP